jgi:hypothetical protein
VTAGLPVAAALTIAGLAPGTNESHVHRSAALLVALLLVATYVALALKRSARRC